MSRFSYWSKWHTVGLVILTALLLSLLYLTHVREKKQNATTGVQKVGPNEWEEWRTIYFGIPTRVRFILKSDDEALAKKLASDAFDKFLALEKVFNSYNPNSEISLINKDKSKKKSQVSPELYQLLEESKKVHLDSSSAFDPTLMSIKKVWQNAEKSQTLPSDSELKSLIAHAGFNKVSLYPPDQLHFSESHLSFDFGGIAKGFAVDKVAELFNRTEVAAAIIQCGGEIRTIGEYGENGWEIGIQHPIKMKEVFGLLYSKNPIQVSTSGNYRQGMIIKGREYYHVFDPRTGHPVSEKILGVTLVALGSSTSSAYLDGMTKAILVLGVKEGMKELEKNNIEAIILLEKGHEIDALITPKLKSFFRKI